MSTFERKECQILNATCSYLQASNSGPPLLLLHGGGSDYSEFSWRDVLKPLSKHYRVYAPDFPGYGHSDWPKPDDVINTNPKRISQIESLLKSNSRLKTENSTLLTQTAFLCAFIEKHELQDVLIAGFSMGGAIALLGALTLPSPIQKVAAINSYGISDKIKRQHLAYLTSKLPFVNKLLRSVLLRSPFVTKLALGELVENRATISRQMVEDAQKSIELVGEHPIWKRFVKEEIGFSSCNLNLSGTLKELRCDVAIIQTDKDRLFFPENARKAADNIATYIELSSAGHIPARECPKALVESLQLFFKKAKPPE